MDVNRGFGTGFGIDRRGGPGFFGSMNRFDSFFGEEKSSFGTSPRGSPSNSAILHAFVLGEYGDPVALRMMV